jgi:hypothetical protein
MFSPYAHNTSAEEKEAKEVKEGQEAKDSEKPCELLVSRKKGMRRGFR